jgi:hypothetical protein
MNRIKSSQHRSRFTGPIAAAFVAGAALCILSATAQGQQEWACVQHDPQHTGRTNRVVFDTPSAFLKWETRTTGSVFGSPVIRNDDAILVSTGNDRHVRCFQAYGIQDWAFATSASVLGAVALSSGGSVFIGDLQGYVYQISSTGSQTWRWRNDPANDDEHRFICDATPMPGGGVYLADWKRNICFIRNGNPVYSPVGMGDNAFAPVTIRSDGSQIYYPTHNNSTTWFYVYCRNASTGAGGWTFSHRPITSGAASPQVSGICLDEANNRLFVSADYHVATGSYLYGINSNTGAAVWSNPVNLGVGTCAIPALSPDGSAIYVTTLNGQLRAFNASNGSSLWSYDSGAEMIRGSAVVDGDGKILFGDMNGVIHCLSSSGTVVWTYADPDESVIASAPAIMDNGDVIYGTASGKLARLTRQPLLIPYVAGGANPDGVMQPGEWRGALKIHVTGERPDVNPGWSALDANPIDPADSSFDLYVMHDGANLYVAMDVTDQDLSSDDHPNVEHANVWDDDCTEVYIDGDFDLDYSEGATGGPADDDEWAEGVSPHFGINNAWWDKNSGTYNSSWWAKTVQNASGFVVEYKIAFSGIDTLDGEGRFEALKPGDTIGFNALHNDDDFGGAREHQLCLFGGDHTGAIYRTQHDWGVAVLEPGGPSAVKRWKEYEAIP